MFAVGIQSPYIPIAKERGITLTFGNMQEQARIDLLCRLGYTKAWNPMDFCRSLETLFQF